MIRTTLSVPSVSCGHCKASIEGALKGMRGIRQATVRLDQKTVEVEYDEHAVGPANGLRAGTLAGIQAIIAAIEAQGYEVVSS